MRPNDSGSAAVEIVLVTPLFLAWLAAFLAGAQVLLARQEVGDAARGALEAALASSTPGGAASAARLAASNALGSDLPRCATYQVTTATSDFVAGGFLSVRVQCSFTVPGVPLVLGPRTIFVAATASGEVEPFRVIG
jgi:Flp pilus assembly protein TadG